MKKIKHQLDEQFEILDEHTFSDSVKKAIENTKTISYELLKSNETTSFVLDITAFGFIVGSIIVSVAGSAKYRAMEAKISQRDSIINVMAEGKAKTDSVLENYYLINKKDKNLIKKVLGGKIIDF
jgi:hypothetical protein